MAPSAATLSPIAVPDESQQTSVRRDCCCPTAAAVHSSTCHQINLSVAGRYGKYDCEQEMKNLKEMIWREVVENPFCI